MALGLFIAAYAAALWTERIGGAQGIWSRYGALAPIISVPLHTVLAVSPIPSDAVPIANGPLYGLWLGAAFSWLGWYAAAFIQFGLGRRLGMDFELDSHRARMPPLLRRLPIAHPAYLIGARLLPWVGGHITTWLPGAAGVPLRRFAWCTALSIVPASVGWAYFGLLLIR